MTVTLKEAQTDLAALIHRLTAESPTPGLRPPPGLLKGAIIILEDDDEHLKDFEEYMS